MWFRGFSSLVGISPEKVSVHPASTFFLMLRRMFPTEGGVNTVNAPLAVGVVVTTLAVVLSVALVERAVLVVAEAESVEPFSPPLVSALEVLRVSRALALLTPSIVGTKVL